MAWKSTSIFTRCGTLKCNSRWIYVAWFEWACNPRISTVSDCTYPRPGASLNLDVDFQGEQSWLSTSYSTNQRLPATLRMRQNAKSSLFDLGVRASGVSFDGLWSDIKSTSHIKKQNFLRLHLQKFGIFEKEGLRSISKSKLACRERTTIAGRYFPLTWF